jgi:hypothetical protein
LLEIPREQFGPPLKAVIDRAPELSRVVDDLPIPFFTDGQTEGTILSGCVSGIRHAPISVTVREIRDWS